MITIVAHFRTEAVKFIFGGRNSGQYRNRGPFHSVMSDFARYQSD
jgi:hypothetical protein